MWTTGFLLVLLAAASFPRIYKFKFLCEYASAIGFRGVVYRSMFWFKEHVPVALRPFAQATRVPLTKKATGLGLIKGRGPFPEATDVPYLRSQIYRCHVSDEDVKWNKHVPDYQPPDYTDPNIIGKPWSDPPAIESSIKWNARDANIDRVSFICAYAFDGKGRPLNPMGRTGLQGRGVLGRWGPNHAADPLVTRFHDGKLQFVAIRRGDTGEWAIPGGMVDAGEVVSDTLKREFTEEAVAGGDAATFDSLWEKGRELYRGYVDDPRNTDNSWMETVVMNFHAEDGLLDNVNFKAGDDAYDVQWINVNDNQSLYASHEEFIMLLKLFHKIA